jgi:transcriptional regulator EpsA
MDTHNYQARLSSLAEPARSSTGSRSSHANAASLDPARAPIGLTTEDSASLLRIVSSGALISRHYEIFDWLRGEVQQLLPHQILLAAWGDFRKRELQLDVTSALPGVRTAQLARCRVDDLVHRGHAEWVAAARRPVLLDITNLRAPRACACPVHLALRNMRSAVVHGVRDRRVGHESLYIALDSAPLGEIPRADGFKFLVDCLIAQIDVAFRRMAAFPGEAPKLSREPDAKCGELSPREQEILGWLCRGTTNVDIGAALAISPHTVKNHLQRIFRKIGVHNRTQAAARYNEALRDMS